MFNLLKLKAKIYQYTAIFLAQKELKKYTDSIDFAEEVNRMISYSDNLPKFAKEEACALLIGSWEGHYGFYRKASKYPQPIAYFHILFLQLKEDIFGVKHEF